MHVIKVYYCLTGGSIWRPPPMNMYTQGMPEELIERDEERKGGLSPAQRDRLEQLIRHMTPERLKVADAMVFCIEHAEAADEICDCILESLSNNTTLLCKKVKIIQFFYYIHILNCYYKRNKIIGIIIIIFCFIIIYRLQDFTLYRTYCIIAVSK